MSRLFTPGRKPLLLPGTTKRALRRPDARGLISPYVSGAALSSTEVDYDDLDILRTWRVYEPGNPDQVRYFCYELAQRDVGADEAERYFKVVRLIRLTRVPRYLREMPEYEQMRDVLVALRERRVLFLNLIAKSPKLPLIFSYGVQGTGDSLEQACDQADEAFAALSFCLDGTYQQLEYEPLTVAQGELLSRYQAEWNNIAMARGRPIPRGTPVGNMSLLDSNRTDVSNSDALENFIRGMSDRSFLLSLVTVPLSPEDMATAWRNLTPKVSAVRSDQQGTRGVTASFSLPIGLGTSEATGSGTTHGLTGTSGIGHTAGLSSSHADGMSYTHTDGTNASVSHTDTTGHSTSTALGHSVAHGQSLSVGHSASATQSHNVGQSFAQGLSHSLSQGITTGTSHTSTDSAAVGQSLSQSQSVSVGQSASHTDGASMSQSHGVSQGSSLAAGHTASSNWTDSLNKSITAGQTLADAWNQSMSQNLSQTWSLGTGFSDGTSHGTGTSANSGVNGGLGGLGGSTSTGHNTSDGSNTGANHSTGVSQTGGGSNSTGTSSSLSNSLSQALGQTESQGGSLANSLTATNSVGTNDSITAGQSIANTIGQSVSQSQGISQGVSQSLGHSESNGQSLAQSTSVGQSTSSSAGVSTGAGTSTGLGQSLTQGQSLSQGVSLTQGAADSSSSANGQSQGVSASNAAGVSATNTAGASTAQSQQQAMSDAYMVAMSRQAGQTGSIGGVPALAASITRQTYDVAKKSIGDMLEAQLNRLHEGIEGGGMLYQMFLVTPDRGTLIGAASLLKDSFWGPGKDDARLPVPFHTIVVDDPDERGRLLTHAAAFTHYRKREPVADIIEPHVYSSYVTAGEASAFAHPPTAESLGIQTQTDSMPVLAMPVNREERDIYLGRIINGERGRVAEARFGVDLNELTHILIQGVTGLGKTTTMMRLLEQAVRLQRTVVTPPTTQNPVITTTSARAGVLCFDWMQNMRDLAGIVEPDRFQLFSVSNPALGRFRWNPLEIPHPTMDPGQWVGAQADNLAASMGLGEVGRSVLAEYIDLLYRSNRLEDVVLREAVLAADGSGVVLRPAAVLPAVDPASLPPGAIRTDGSGKREATVYSCPELSRLVSLSDVATMVADMVEKLATPEGARMYGTAMRDRIQSVWRRIQYYAPGSAGAQMVAADPDLRTRTCLGVPDLIDPDRGLVTVIETDGLDLENRRVILGSVMLAIYRYGLHVGKGCFDHGGSGPGTFLVLEEAHELFGAAGESEDKASATMRANLYESMFRRARASGLRLVAMTQNCGAIPSAVTSQTTTVLVHRTYDDEDRKRVFSLLNWSNSIGQQMREWRYLGEMPRGYCIARLDARDSYLESAPVQLLIDPPALAPVTDQQLAQLAAAAGRN